MIFCYDAQALLIYALALRHPTSDIRSPTVYEFLGSADKSYSKISHEATGDVYRSIEPL